MGERNQTIVHAALAYVRRSAWGVAHWDLAAHLLAIGLYKHPVPPDPLAEIWTPEVWAREAKGKWLGPVDEDFLAEPDYNLEDPQDLAREYQPTVRRPRVSPKGRQGKVTAYTLRVNHRTLPKVWREIVLAQDNTL